MAHGNGALMSLGNLPELCVILVASSRFQGGYSPVASAALASNMSCALSHWSTKPFLLGLPRLATCCDFTCWNIWSMSVSFQEEHANASFERRTAKRSVKHLNMLPGILAIRTHCHRSFGNICLQAATVIAPNSCFPSHCSLFATFPTWIWEPSS